MTDQQKNLAELKLAFEAFGITGQEAADCAAIIDHATGEAFRTFKEKLDLIEMQFGRVAKLASVMIGLSMIEQSAVLKQKTIGPLIAEALSNADR